MEWFYSAVLDFFTNLGFWTTFVVVTAVCWFITPFGLVILGLIAESRLVPFGRKQFRAFMPGDLFLGVGIGWFAALVTLVTDRVLVFAFGWLQIAFLPVVFIILMVFRSGEKKVYEPRAFRSPTKVYHDYVVIGLLLYVVLTLIAIDVFGGVHLGLLALGLVPFVPWIAGLIYDGTRDKIVGNLKVRSAHVHWWSPIWVTRRMIWHY